MSSPVIIASDSFAGSNVSPLSAPWATVGSNALQQVSNRVRGTALTTNVSRYGSFNVSMMRCTATAVSANTSTGHVGAGVRCSSTAETYYIAYSSGNLELNLFVNGNPTNLGNATTAVSGDTIGCLATGSNISAYKNGVEVVAPVSNSTIESGTWCIRIYESTNLANNELDDVVMEAYEPVFMGSGAKGETASGNCTLGEPTYATGFTKANDDIWLAAVHSTDQVAHTFTNWTQIVQGNGGGSISRLSVWYHRYAGSNPNFAVTHASGGPIVGGIVAFRNCLATGSPVNVSSAILTGTDASIEHTAVTPTEDETKLLAINGAGDDNARTALTGYTALWEDPLAAAQLCYVTSLGVDGSVCIFQKNSNVGQTVSSGTITVTQAAADAWASTLVALEGSAAVATPITVDVPADALGSYADELTVERRGPPRWNDSVAFTKADVGTTAKEANFAADALGSYADAPSLKLAFFTSPAADSMAIVDQAATVTRALIVSLSDALGGYADQLTVSFRLNGAFTDSLGPYVDQAPTISRDLLIAQADSFPAYTDTANGFFTLAPKPSDDLNQWADQRTVFVTGTAALTAEPPPDNLGGYVDTSNAFITFAVRPSDDLNQWADLRTIFLTGMAALTAEPPADFLNNWADPLTILFGEFVVPSADSMTMADQLGVSLLTIKSASFADALPSYTDQATIRLHKAAGVSDALGSYADALTATAAKNVSRIDSAANLADQVAGGAQSLTRIGWQDSVVATTLPVRIGWQDSVTVVRSLGTDRIVQLTSIKPVHIDSSNLLYGYNHGFVIYLVDELGNYILDENGNRIITSGLIDNLALGDSVAITRTQQNITPIERSFTDAIPGPLDSLQVTRGIIPVVASLSDALPVHNDAIQFTEVGLLNPSFSDNLAGYTDSPAISTTGEKRVSQSDAIPAYIDSAQIQYTGFLTAAASDSLENYVDDATINTSGGISVLLSDAIDPPNDFIQAHRTGALSVSLTDAIGVPIDAAAISRAGILKVTASDNLAAYADTPTHGRGLFYSTPADGLANYLDIATRGGTGLIQAALSDNLGQYSDTPPATFANFKAQPPGDDLAAYGDSLTGLLGINIVHIDGLGLGQRYDDLIDFRLGSMEEIRLEFSDDLDQWADAAAYNRSYFAIHLSGKTVDQINLTGKIVEEQISVNGKVHDKADISGELYIGDSG